MSNAPFAVLRVRPSPVAAEGLPRERLTALARAVAEVDSHEFDESDAPVVERFHIAPVAITDPETARDLVSTLLRLLQSSRTIIIDLNFSARRYRGGFDLTMAEVARSVHASVRDDHRLVVLVNRVPANVDHLTQALTSGTYARRAIVIDSAGNISGQSDQEWQPPPDLGDLARTTAADLRGALAQRIVRRRGVFETSKRDLTPFRYTAEQATTDLTRLLQSYFDEQEVDVVVYDSTRTAWFNTAVVGACSGVRRCFSIADVDPPASGADNASARFIENAAAVLSDASHNVCLVTTMRRSGQNIRVLMDRLRTKFEGSVSVLTIMSEVDSNSDRRDEGSYFRERTSIAGERHTVDWFVDVHHELLSEDDWRVKAAHTLDEVEDPEAAWVGPSRVGMWSLFVDLGFDREVPFPDERKPITAFPQLHSVDHWDDLWLAESIVRCAEDQLSCKRSEMLLVLPDEPSGSRPIAEALDRRLDIAVASVSRRVLAGKDEPTGALVRRLREYRDFRVVVVDESTITYGTLRSLDDVVANAIGRRADLAVAVVELASSDERRPATLKSLYRWKPILFDEPDELTG